MSVETGTIVKLEPVEEYVYSEDPPLLVRGYSTYGAFKPEGRPESNAEYVIGKPFTSQRVYPKHWFISRRDGSATPLYILIQNDEGKYFTLITQVGFKPKPVLVEVV